MRNDRPTMPNLPSYDPVAPPPWPVAEPYAPRTGPRGGLFLLLGVSFAVNAVLFVSLLGVLVLARAGAIAPSASSAQPTASAVASTPSATALAGGLQVAPTSVQLSCASGQQTQYVVLVNSGPQEVRWQVSFSGSSGDAAVTVYPTRGDLRPGTSISIKIQIRSHASNQDGVIRFDPATGEAGGSASLSYTTTGCD